MSLRQERKLQIADPGWVSLRQAVFECFWKHELKNGVDRFHLQYTSSVAPKTVEINATDQTLKFIFSDGSILEGAPWDFLCEIERLPRDAFAAALLHKAVREIWNTMNDSFNRKVSSRAVSLFARMDDFRAEFASIPSDHWSLCKVTDWKNGAAIAQDGRVMFSIHAKLAHSPSSASAGRKPIYNQDHINAKVLKAVEKMGFPTPNGEIGWQSAADVGRLVRDVCIETKGQEPVISTLQRLVRKALIAAKAKLDTDN
jgi:hypothetical protein